MLQCTRCCGFTEPMYGPRVELDQIDYVPGTRVISRVRCVECAADDNLQEALDDGVVL